MKRIIIALFLLVTTTVSIAQSDNNEMVSAYIIDSTIMQ